MTDLHANIGTLVLVVNLVAGLVLFFGRQSKYAGHLRIASLLGFVLLVVQVALGADLWLRGLRPADGPLAEIHMAGPVVALAFYVLVLLRAPASRGRAWLAAAALLTAVMALVSYSIGEIG